MSMFLGPIHYWLFSKIQIVESRRDRYMEALAKKFGDEFAPKAQELDEEYGPKLNSQPLDSLVGDNPIHGLLQSLVNKVETGEGKVVAAALEKYETDAFNLLLEEAEKHGRETGERAVTEKNLSHPSTEEIFQVLNDYLLEGMPCDNVTVPNPKSEDCFELKHVRCLHQENWIGAGAPLMEMCCFLNTWIGAFVKAVNPEVSYERNMSIASGDSGCQAEFKK